MRSLSLSSAFDLTQGEISRHAPKTLLARDNTFPRARNAPPPSNVSSRHRGAKDRPTPSRSMRAIDLGSARTATPADRCSTPITELYQAIGEICGDESSGSSPQSTSNTVIVGPEHPTTHGDCVVPSCPPSDRIRTLPFARAPEVGNILHTVIYETGSRPIGSIPGPAPHRSRGVEPLNTPCLATGGGKRVAPPPRRDSQRSKQVKHAPQTRRGDELFFLCRVPATTETLSQHNQPDPQSPLARRHQAALPTHPCCSLARRDLKRVKDAASLRAPLVRSQFYGPRQEMERTTRGLGSA